MNRDDIPALEKAAVSHYYFEYVHPFYDGNGRTGRYIFAGYLARKLDILSAICLSYSVHKNRKLYADAFSETTHRHNFGEATFFILAMLEIIVEGQAEIISFLRAKLDNYKKLSARLSAFGATGIEQGILDIYAQVWAMLGKTSERDAAIADAAYKTGKISRRTLNKTLQNLRERGVLEQIKKRPSEHRLAEKCIRELQE